MTNLEKLAGHFKALRKNATARPWTAQRQDHDREITYEVGPKHDGKYGFRFVMYETSYEAEHPNGKFTRNVAKLKGDAAFITASCNAEEKLLAIIGVLVAGAEEMDSCGLTCFACTKLDNALSEADRLAGEILGAAK